MPDPAGGRVISGEREITREMLLGRALRAAGGFAALGVKPGDTLALVLRNDFPFFEASFAAQMLGAYCVPVNWHGKAPEIGTIGVFRLRPHCRRVDLARRAQPGDDPDRRRLRLPPPRPLAR